LGNRFTAVVAVYASLVLLAGCGAPTRVYHPTADEIRDETGFDEGSSIRPTLSPTGSDQDRERHDAKRHSRASAPTEEAARRVAVANLRWQAIAGNEELVMPERAAKSYLIHGDGSGLSRAQRRLLDFVQSGFIGTSDETMQFEVSGCDTVFEYTCDVWSTGDSATANRGMPWSQLAREFSEGEAYYLERELERVRVDLGKPHSRMGGLERLDEALRLGWELCDIFAAGCDASSAGGIRQKTEELQEEYDWFFYYATMSPSRPDTTVVRVSNGRTEPVELSVGLFRSEEGLEEPLYGVSIQWTADSDAVVLSDSLAHTDYSGRADVTVLEVTSSAGTLERAVVFAELALGGATRIGREFPLKIINTGTHEPTRLQRVVPDGGSYLCGDSRPDSERPFYAREEELVQLREFFIEEHEVTVGQYIAFADATGRRLPVGTPRTQENSRLPMTQVTFDDACAYCAWIGRRLPSECEWELAARGATRYLYLGGSESVPGRAIYDRSSGPVAVPSKSNDISPYNVFDMAGNVAEWCTVSGRAAIAGSAAGPIICGGSYMTRYHDELYLTYRYQTVHTGSFAEVGFRCAQHAP